jgi:putative transposase
MPRKEASPMDQRTQFIADYLRDVLSITELCTMYGVTRKTGYKWIDRYLRQGPAGLEERSRRPRRAPNETPEDIVAAILEARRHHPSWGGKKLLALLHKRYPRWPLPGRSTACDILSRHGMVPRRRQRRRIGHPGKPTSQILAPNDVWTADYKGQFRTGDARYCYPLTVADGFSRYLLGCQALSSTAVVTAKPVFTRLFQEYGLPKRIRSDNGVPFATNTLARLSTLSAWWVRLGILPELIEPGHPEQNGRHERMHRTLKAETTRPAAGSLAAQQRRFNVFRTEFQRRAAPRGAGSTDAGGVLHGLAAADAGPAAAGRVPRPVRSPLRQRQRRHPLERALGERLDRVRGGVRRVGGDCGRALERLLWAAEVGAPARAPHAD